MQVGDRVFYARIMPSVGLYDVYELKIRTLEKDWFVGMEKGEKHAYLFSNKDIGKVIFTERHDALEVVTIAEDKGKRNNENEL